MKIRFSFAIGLLALLCLPAGLALADNGPHGNYTATTDACAGCHRAHTAVGPNLLVENNTYALCMSCHGTAGPGADTNVEDGVYLERDGNNEVPDEGGADSQSLKGGGFTNAWMDTNINMDSSDTGASAPTTSSHIANGNTGTAWGHGGAGAAGTVGFSLSCASCHDPHGGAASDGGPTYRILRNIPLNSGGSGHDVPDEGNKVYTVSDTNRKTGDQYFGEGYPDIAAPWSSFTLMDDPEHELSEWCAQCHTRYLMEAPGGGTTTGSTDTGDSLFAFRHLSGGAPDATTCGDSKCHGNPNHPQTLGAWGGPMWSHQLECVTCHVAHGSSASMGGYAGTVEWPDGTVAPSGNERSSLLRVDSRGTCQLCHGK